MDRKNVIYDIERCICHVPDACRDCSHYGHGEVIGCMEELLTDALALLKEQEEKTGKWERQYSRPGVYANLFWWCSVCGEPTGYNDAGIFYQYCPHCGAKLEACKET